MLVLFQTPDLLILLAVMACLLIGSGFFSLSETALFFLSEDEVRAFQRSTRASERRVAELLSDPDRLLTAVLFWNLLLNVTCFATGVVVSERLVSGGHATAAGAFGLINVTAVIVVAEVLPKSSAVLFRQQISRMVSLPLGISVRAFDPLSPAFIIVTRSFRRAFWPAIQREQYLDPRDLERAIENSAGDEIVVQQERNVLHNILDLSEIPVKEIMRPRGTYKALKSPIDLRLLKDLPVPPDYVIVLEEDGEDIDGAIPLLRFASFPAANLEAMLSEVVHVPWCATVAFTLQHMEEHKAVVSAVVNEYGEAIGIVTWEDIVDTILSTAPHRETRLIRRDPVLNVGPDQWQVESITSLRFLRRRLDVTSAGEEDRQVTVAGLFHEALERIPEVGDECFWAGWRLRVIETWGRGHFRSLMTRDQ